MEGLGRRLIYYSIGLLIGTLFVVSMWGNRSCTWLPNNRVKKTILHKLIVFPENQIPALEELGINRDNIYNFFLKEKIDFFSSIKKQGDYPKVYVYHTNDTIKKRLTFTIFEDSYITAVHVLEDDEEPQQHMELGTWGRVVGLPRDSALVFIDKSSYTQCKASKLASNDLKQITKDIKYTGKINFDQSDLLLPKAEIQLYFTQNDTLEVQAQTIWFETRINIKDFIWDEKLDCEDKVAK